MATINTHKSHTVYLSAAWPPQWFVEPYLYCNNFTFAASPSTQSATLEYDYGRKIRAGQQTWANYSKLDLLDPTRLNYYVKVVVNNGPTWYGTIVDVDDQRDGEASRNGAATLTGKQTILCRGFEFFLQRRPITTSIVKTTAGEQTIERAIGFNLGAGHPGAAYREGNAALVAGAKNTAIFASDLQNAREWTANDILHYLVRYLFPRNKAGGEDIRWTFNENVVRQYLAYHKPTLQIHGKTAWQVLNELIDRRRLLSWWVYIDPNNEVPEIRVFPFNRNPIALPDGNVIINNQDQVAWSFDNDNKVQTCVIATDDSARFHRVIVKGEPPGAVFTVQMPGGGGNGYLETDWATDQQTAYRAGASGEAGYAALDSWQKHNANQTARTKDSLKKVFRYFRLSPTVFTGTIGGNPVWPVGSSAQDRVQGFKFWYPGLRFQDRLPLRIEHDYTNPQAVTNEMKDKSKWEYQRPFAFIQDSNGQYFFLDRAGRGESVDTHLQSSGRFWAANLRMQDDAPGIIVDAGAIQHVIAKDTFVPIDDDDETDYETDVDYNYLGATVFAEGDGNVTVSYGPNGADLVRHVVNDLIIYAPNCRLDTIAAGTVIDIAADGSLVTSIGGFIQDDTPYMKSIARTAYEWYSQPRRAMNMTAHELGWLALNNVNGQATTISIGVFVRSIGANNPQDINSVVTQASYDLLAGTASYTTQFAELDLQ